MVKRYYIQDYPENFRGNTETRTIASDFMRPSTESSLNRREKKKPAQIRHVVRVGAFLQVVIIHMFVYVVNSYRKVFQRF